MVGQKMSHTYISLRELLTGAIKFYDFSKKKVYLFKSNALYLIPTSPDKDIVHRSHCPR